MLYKYAEYINAIEDCPPTDYQNRTVTVFRWVHEEMDHPNNFLPVALINPRRVNATAIDLQEKCALYGLSMFDSMNNARKRYRALTAQNPRFPKTVGEYVAEGKLLQTDGVISSANQQGHLTLYEYEGIDLKTKFTIVGSANGNG